MVAAEVEAHRLVLLGAESTGTTTLTDDLAALIGAPSTSEALRDVCERKAVENGGEFFGCSWRTEDFDEVADRQEDLERAAVAAWDPRAAVGRPLADLAPLLVCDTDALATALWHRRYLGDAPSRFFERAAADPPLLYVLTSPDGVSFVQDGWRDGEHVRAEMHGWFRDALASQDVPWIEVGGSPDQRIRRVLEHVTAATTLPA
jgi:HTH-type transcriptional repressor of NAD biosynthesis genes